MAHRLEPPMGRPYLEPDQVIRLLRDEFAVCDVDSNQGAEDVGNMIVKLIELKAPQSIIDAAVSRRAQSFRVTIADNDATDNYLSFILQPETGPLIGYYSAQHEAATRPLLDRCAKALAYEIVLV